MIWLLAHLRRRQGLACIFSRILVARPTAPNTPEPAFQFFIRLGIGGVQSNATLLLRLMIPGIISSKC
jgi:hypothetical protein